MTRSQVYSSHPAVLQFAFYGFAVVFCGFRGLHSASFAVLHFFGRKRKVSYKVLLFSMCTEKKN